MYGPFNAQQYEERFWRRVDRSGGPDACWPWTAGKSGEGYGTTWRNGRNQFVHRVSYELLVGEIPAGLHIDHLCRNRACVNPAHLQPVTRKENILRGVSPTAVHAAKETCVRGHPFSYRNSRGERRCRECDRYRERRAALAARTK